MSTQPRLEAWRPLAGLISLGIVLGGLLQGNLEANDVVTISGKATYYTEVSCKQEGTSGVWTASSERYDESAYTVALPWRGFGQRYRVCRAEHPERCVVVRHTDYGPGRGARARGVVADLTPAAFDALGGMRGLNRHGVAWGELAVTLERVQ